MKEKKGKDEMIKEILEEFNFAKVEKVMCDLGWKWAGDPKPPLVPELREEAENRLNSAIEQVLSEKNKNHPDIGWISSSGGFEARAWKTKKGNLSMIQLRFIVTDWRSER